MLGIPRDRYAAYENERTPLKFTVGWELCRQCNVNQLWLVGGQGRREGFLTIERKPESVGIDYRTHFVEGVRRLWPDLADAAKQADIPDAEIPECPSAEDAEARAKGITFATVQKSAKGKIPVCLDDIRAARLVVSAEFISAIPPPHYPATIELRHPGQAVMNEFLVGLHPNNEAFALLKRCLVPQWQSEEMLNRLAPAFVLELMLAAQKLTGIWPLKSTSTA